MHLKCTAGVVTGMLRIVYDWVGAGGTLFLATVGFVSAISLLMAVAGVVIRGWPRPLKWVVIVAMSLLPPLSLFVLGYIHFKEQTYRRQRIARQ